MEKECAKSDLLWVSTDPRVKEGDGKEEEWIFAWEIEESVCWEEWGVVREIPTCKENDRCGDSESNENSWQRGFEIGAVPELSIFECWVETEIDEHRDKSQQQDREDEESGGESGFEAE